VAYKNLFDWCSRINPKVYQGKSMVLLAASPGPNGGSSVLASAVSSMPYFGGVVKASYSVPYFNDNFDTNTQKMTNQKMNTELKAVVGSILS
jgi:NAD(P)H-dependent FMN reductase